MRMAAAGWGSGLPDPTAQETTAWRACGASQGSAHERLRAPGAGVLQVRTFA